MPSCRHVQEFQEAWLSKRGTGDRVQQGLFQVGRLRLPPFVQQLVGKRALLAQEQHQVVEAVHPMQCWECFLSLGPRKS